METANRRSQWPARCCSMRSHEDSEKAKPNVGDQKTMQKATSLSFYIPASFVTPYILLERKKNKHVPK